MPLQSNLRQRLERVLSTADDQSALGTRLKGDALRLWGRVRRFAKDNLIGPDYDSESLELACYAMQLPMRQTRGVASAKLRTNLRERCEQAAELLVTLFGEEELDEALLDRSTRILHEVPHRSPVIDEARLLADAVNLDDYGVTGVMIQTIQLAVHGDGVADVVVAADKRDEYGYWEARLKDGFHFEPIRAIAARRLENARQVLKILADELKDDQP